MADLPIPFSAPMARALLAGAKTQTRRALKNPEYYGCPTGDCPHQTQAECNEAMGALGSDATRFSVGDRLYVREEYFQRGHWEPVPGARTKGGRQKWAFMPTGPATFVEPAEYRKGRHHKDPATVAWHKRLGRFMPRALSRMTLTVTEVRVERLQDISEADAIAEGIVWQDPTEEDYRWARNQGFPVSDMQGVWSVPGAKGPTKADVWGTTPQQAYQFLWNAINGPGAWEANPWVVAVSFTVGHHNIDQVPA